MNTSFGWTLARISLINWSGFIVDDIEPGYDNTLITAPNGTGKTAIFDAYSVCVGGGRSQDVDQSRDKNSRTALGYILGTYQGGTMRDSAVGFIGLVFENKAKGKKVSLVVRMAGRNGDLALAEMNSLIALNTDISTDDMLEDNRPLDWTEFYDLIKSKSGGKVKAYSRNNTSNFRSDFLDQVTPPGRNIEFKKYQKLMTMMKLGVGTKGDFKEEEFIRKHIIGSENKIDLGPSRESIKELRENIARNTVFQKFINQVLELDEISRKSSEMVESLSNKEKDFEHSENVKTIQAIYKAIEDKKKLVTEKENLSNKIEEDNQRYVFLLNRNAELKNSEAANLISQKKSELKYVSDDVNRKSSEVSQVMKSVESDRKFLSSIGLDYDILTEEELEAKKLQIDELIAENTTILSKKNENVSDIKKKISHLKDGTPANFKMLSLSSKVHERCSEKGIKINPLYKLVDEKIDSKYALAIETALGNLRFAMIPETWDDYYKAKREIYEKAITVVMPYKDDSAKYNSLAEKISSSNEFAKSFLNYSLGKLFPMGDNDKAGDNSISLEADYNGVLKRVKPRSSNNLDPVPASEFVLGKPSKEEIDSEIHTLQDKLFPLEEEVIAIKSKLKNDKRALDKVNRIVIGNNLSDLKIELERCESRKSTLENEIERLVSEDKSLEEMQDNERKLAYLEKSYKENSNKISDIDQKIGNTNGRIESLRKHFLKSTLVDYGKANDTKIDFLTPYEIEYLDKHKGISVSKDQIEKLRNEVVVINKKKQSIRLRLSDSNTKEYSAFPDIYTQGNNILHAASQSDESLFKEVDSVLKSEGVMQREEVDDFAKKNVAMIEKLHEHVRENYIKGAYTVICDIRRGLRGLNNSVKTAKLHNGVYSFAYTAHNEKKRWINLIESYNLDTMNNLPEEDKETFNEIVDAIVESDDDNNPQLDPISWFRYNIKVSVEGKTMTLDEWKGGGSGGMKKVPGYIALLGAVKSMTAVSKNESGPTLLFIDEAMEQIDSRNSAAVVDMYKAAGIQVIYLTNSSNFPKTSVSKIINMYPKNDHSVVVDEPILVKEPAKDMTRQAMSTVIEQEEMF